MGVTSSYRPKQNPGGGPSSVARLLGVAVSVKPPRPRVAPRKPAGSEVCGRGDCAGKHGENGGRCQLSALASANLDRSCPVVIDRPARTPSATHPGRARSRALSLCARLWTSRVQNDYYPRMHKPPSPIPTTVRPARARARARSIVAIAALAGAALISACGSSSTTSSTATTDVDTARVAASIEQSVLEKRHIHTTVVCPTTVPQETGKTFECIATTTKAPITKTPFVVTVQNSKGYVTYVGK